MIFRPFAKDGIAAVLVVLAGASVAHWRAEYAWAETWLQADRNDHLGAEYNSIAKAICSGRGFSDPFREESGPTAWMPPLLPFMLAAGHWWCDGNARSVQTIFRAAQSLALIIMAYQVLSHSRQLGKYRLGFALLAIGLASNFHELFQKTHDTSLLLFVVSATWYGFKKIWHTPRKRLVATAWGGWGGICGLCSPVLGFAWATLTFIGWWRNQLTDADSRAVLSRQHTLACLVLASISSAVVMSPWLIRNKIVFDRWIPIKSNAAYELWQAQCKGPFGLLDDYTLAGHPWGDNGEQRKRYIELGEVSFLDEKRALAFMSISTNPMEFVNRVINRALAAFVLYIPTSAADSQRGYGWLLVGKRIVFSIPILSLLAILVFCRTPLEPALIAAIGLWILCLLPYVLISYYDRYAAPLIGMKLIVVLHGITAIQSSIAAPRGSPVMAAWASRVEKSGWSRYKRSVTGNPPGV